MRFLTTTLFATLLSAPAFAADLGMYRPGTPYNSTVAAGADVCDSQCAGDAQCRGWNYVKPNPRAAGICEFLSSTSAPIASQISISGESQTVAPFSSRVMTGATNTVRVGTTVTPQTSTVTVGQSPSGRRIVRQAPAQRMSPQHASTRPVQDMSLTAQQNRYRQGQTSPQMPARAQSRTETQQPTRPMFRPILDAPTPQQAYAPQRPVTGQPQRQLDPRRANAQRRATGPRNLVAPQSRTDPRRMASPQGSSRPRVGQPIPAPQNMQRNMQSQVPNQAQYRSQPSPQPRVMSPSQRVAQLTAQTRNQMPMTGQPVPSQAAVSLSPEQARRSLFGRLNDDVKAPQDLPTVSSVPTQAVTQEPLDSPYGDLLAGGR